VSGQQCPRKLRQPGRIALLQHGDRFVGPLLDTQRSDNLGDLTDSAGSTQHRHDGGRAVAVEVPDSIANSAYFGTDPAPLRFGRALQVPRHSLTVIALDGSEQVFG